MQNAHNTDVLRTLIESSLFIGNALKEALLAALPTLPAGDLSVLFELFQTASDQQTAFLEALLQKHPEFLKELKAFGQKELRRAYAEAEARETNHGKDILQNILNDAIRS